MNDYFYSLKLNQKDKINKDIKNTQLKNLTI